jgi:Protein of unknown function (DUF1579)
MKSEETTRSPTVDRETSAAEPAPKLGPEHRRLEVFLGTWMSKGQTEAGPNGPAEKMMHHHSYEWLPGGFHLFHRWDGHIGEHESKGIEIIGYDAPSEAYDLHFFDSDGWSRIYKGTVHGRTWTLKGAGERCTIVFSEDAKTMTTHWDRTTDGVNWHPLCDVISTKIK